MRSRQTDKAVELIDDKIIDQFSISGTPEDVIDKLEMLEKKGLTHIMVGDPFRPYPKKSLEILGDKVIPVLKKLIVYELNLKNWTLVVYLCLLKRLK
ncbi:MAG: hypothetical protein J7L07_08750 [Candidatus Odinarchaeota archaeon]|nr:hypothetical protein [Candidatus Odinarchaeota archaeon]